MNRPNVKDFFADIEQAHNAYLSQPELFRYTQALDNYIDYLEASPDWKREVMEVFDGMDNVHPVVSYIEENYVVSKRQPSAPVASGNSVEQDLEDAMEECNRLAEVAEYWQKKYYELNPPQQPVKLDNL